MVVDDHDAHPGCAQLIGVLLSRAGQVQAHLGALAGRRPDLGGAAVAVHPVDDAVPDAVPVARGRRPGRSRAPRSRTKTSTAAAVTSAYTSTWPVPACLAALVTASRVAATTGAQRLGEVAVADGDDVDRRRRGCPRPRRRRRAGRWRGCARRSPPPANSQARRSRSWARASRATVVPSPAFFWIRASVCSTESCRCAATSARSWVRTRSARSAVRSEASRKIHGPDDDRRARRRRAAPRRRRPGPAPSEPPRNANTHERDHDQRRRRRRAGRTTPSRRCRTPPAPGRSGRWCRASARAGPRRPAARAGATPTDADERSARTPRPGPKTASSSRTPPNAERRRARSPGRRRRAGGSGRGAARRGWRSPGRGRRCRSCESAGSTSHRPA